MKNSKKISMPNSVKEYFKPLFNTLFLDKKSYQFDLSETQKERSEFNTFHDVVYSETDSNKLLENANKNVYDSLDVNLEYLKVKYNSLINSDIVFRTFTLKARNRDYNAVLIYIDGMVNSQLLNDFVLEPLMLRNRANTYSNDENMVISEAVTNNITVRKIKKFNLADYIYNSLVPQNSIKKETEFKKIIEAVNMGNCILLVDTLNIAFNLDVKGFKQRGVEKPSNEIVIRGSQEAFTEVIRINTSLIRRMVNNENLIIEDIAVGTVSKTRCAICYMKNIANNDLVAEVKYRLNNLNIDSLLSSGQLEQLIQDNGRSSLPQMISTERPDKASSLILAGRVVVIVNGSPYVLIMPGILIDFLSSPEDTNLKHQYANLLKFVRTLGFLITLFLPGLYIAITTYHQEIIPTELLFAIVASRESVPFPLIFELLLMEVSFELIREAGLRVPSPIGPTIGIIGALILGQAAVDANIVSPVLIIIVAITGIASFSIPDFSLSFHCRVIRFVFTFLGYFLGFLGISFGIFIYLLSLSNLKSFGVPYLAPFVPYMNSRNNGVFLSPTWKRESRFDFLNTKKKQRQEHISMGWKYSKMGDDGNDYR